MPEVRKDRGIDDAVLLALREPHDMTGPLPGSKTLLALLIVARGDLSGTAESWRVEDAKAALAVSVGLLPEDRRYDVDRSSTVNSRDAAMILRMVDKKETDKDKTKDRTIVKQIDKEKQDDKSGVKDKPGEKGARNPKEGNKGQSGDKTPKDDPGMQGSFSGSVKMGDGSNWPLNFTVKGGRVSSSLSHEDSKDQGTYTGSTHVNAIVSGNVDLSSGAVEMQAKGTTTITTTFKPSFIKNAPKDYKLPEPVQTRVAIDWTFRGNYASSGYKGSSAMPWSVARTAGLPDPNAQVPAAQPGATPPPETPRKGGTLTSADGSRAAKAAADKAAADKAARQQQANNAAKAAADKAAKQQQANNAAKAAADKAAKQQQANNAAKAAADRAAADKAAANKAAKAAADEAAARKQQVTLAACKQNCQKQYDQRIQGCAGYRLGNTSKACADPIAKDLKICLSSCK